MALILKLNTELFRATGILTLILFFLETLKDGYVSFFINPVVVLLIFLASGVLWLFTPGFAKAPSSRPDFVEKIV